MDDDEVNMTSTMMMMMNGNGIVVGENAAKIVIVPEAATAGATHGDLDDGDVTMATTTGHEAEQQQSKTMVQPMETSTPGGDVATAAGEDEDREHQRTAAQLRAMAVSAGRSGSPAATLSESNDGAGSSSNNSNNGFASALSSGAGMLDGEDEFADADTRMTPRAKEDGCKSSADEPAGRRGANNDDNATYPDKDRLKPFVKTCAKFNLSGGSGSGDHDGMVSMEDGTDNHAKKRKTRRGKPKHRKLKPYSKTQQQQQQQPFQQRPRGRGASGRPTKNMRQGQTLAPNNTTQFIIEDHHELEDLEQRLSHNDGPAANGATTHHFTKPQAQLARTRDSSFSVDSDDDFFYSSPEDEDEFLTKEFSTAYEDVHAERLSGLSKGELIQEYLALEARVDSLTKRLRSSRSSANQQHHSQLATTIEEGENAINTEATKKQLRVYQQKIDELLQQNEHLRRENDVLKQRLGRGGTSPMSSVDSESDSGGDSKCCSATSECSCQGASNKSPGGSSSPVPSSYHANRPDKQHQRNKLAQKNANSELSSVDSESDSTSTTSSEDGEPDYQEDGARRKPGTNVPTSPNGELSNGHAASHELIGLPMT